MSLEITVNAVPSEETKAWVAEVREMLDRLENLPPKPPEDPPEDPLKYFSFEHLPAGTMRDMSVQFYNLAKHVQARLPYGAERSVALRKLLEGKDAAVRAAMGDL